MGYSVRVRARTTSIARCRSTRTTTSNPNHWRASASYVTGSHNMKVGYQGSLLINETNRVRNAARCSRTASTRACPTSSRGDSRTGRRQTRTSVAAFFVQDTWTRGRLTLQGALRYDRAWSWSPAGEQRDDAGTSPLNPAPITFEQTIERRRLQRHHAALRRRLRRVRQRQDGGQVQHGPLPRRRDQRQRLHAQQPGEPHRQHVRPASWTDSDNDKVVDCNLLEPRRRTASARR